MAHQYIFTMQNLRKVVPPQREILRGIWLSFLPGAKIGVLGLNGAGKSTLLKIMAGLDKDFAGEAHPAEGIRIGFLPQDPRLDPAKDVVGNVEEGVAKTRALLSRFDELNEKMAGDLSEAESEKLMAEYQRVQDAIEASNAWELDHQLEIAAEYYSSELEYKLKKLTGLFEPAVIIFMGLIVGFVAVALISAMYGVFNSSHVLTPKK